MNRQWWQDRDVFVAVAFYGVDKELDGLTTLGNLLHYIEKPWKYDDLHEAWEDDQAKQGELMDEARAIL